MSSFLPAVFSAIYTSLQPQYLKFPSSTQDWDKIAEDFNNIWNFSHTLGAIDGKHIRIIAPPKSGTTFYNYKKFFSVVLLAAVDAHGKFLYIDVGTNGKGSDGGILKRGSFYNMLQQNNLNLPKEKTLPGRSLEIPYFFVGDSAFGLSPHIMKPYDRNSNLSVNQKIFNYRISRARMVVEMAFGRLASRFRIFHRPIDLSLETTDLLIMATCALHNFLTKEIIRNTNSPDCAAETMPETFSNFYSQQQGSSGYKYATRIRKEVQEYCISDGAIDQQWGKI